MKDEKIIFECDHIGAALTTPVRIKDHGGKFEARAGVAIMGSTNMTDEQMDAQGRDPFKDDWYDNTVRGEGDTGYFVSFKMWRILFSVEMRLGLQ